MQSLNEFIEKNKLFQKGETIGIGCSGGSDSMALLHYLALNQKRFDIEVVAIHINHKIRDNSFSDLQFVKEKASELGVRFYSFDVDVPKLASEKGQSTETAARDARYNIFRTLVKKGIVNKIALAHHKSDQAETILMHIFRGSGLSGAKGMEKESEGMFVRPLLDTSKEEILDYLSKNELSFVEDCTNVDTSYNRNYVRHVIMKDIISRWPNAIESIVNFGKAVSEDDEFISSQVYEDAVIFEDKIAKIPLSYFVYSPSIISRIIFKAFKGIGINKDIERKHLELILKLASVGENGKKINLPFEAVAIKEYDYLTIISKQKPQIDFNAKFGSGELKVPNFGKICVKRVKKGEICEEGLKIDYKKLPKDAAWRFRKEGDSFTKFGGGTKKLKSYFIDKKVPARLRDYIPVLGGGFFVFYNT